MKSITSFLILSLLFIGKSQNLFCQKIIHMQKDGGVFTIPCSLNGVGLKFIFDTGASDVSISLTEANFLFKNGYLTNNDIIGKAKYSDATGNISVGTIINIRKLEFQGLIIYNIKASIVHQLNAPLLLGQSAMAKLGKFQFDPNNGTLTILNNSTKDSVGSFRSSKYTSDEYINNGISKFKLKDYYGAIDDYTKAIALYPNARHAYNDRALAKSRLQQDSEAVIDYTKAINIDPTFSEAYTNRGVSKNNLSDYRGAILDFTMAIEINPDDSKAYYNRGIIKLSLGQNDSACFDFSKAGELGSISAYERIKEHCN